MTKSITHRGMEIPTKDSRRNETDVQRVSPFVYNAESRRQRTLCLCIVRTFGMGKNSANFNNGDDNAKNTTQSPA